MQLSASEPIELSRIYPTPPSVDNNEGDKYDEIKMMGMGGSELIVSNLLWENVSHLPSIHSLTLTMLHGHWVLTFLI